MRTRGVLHREQVKLTTRVRPSSQKSGTRVMTTIVMRDRSKNRKPLQKGRNLSIEAIQTVQALKRAAIHSERSLEQVFDDKFRRLLKFDMIAVLRELLRQNQCLLAVQVFEDVRKEDWYKPQLLLYAELVTVLGRNGFLENVGLVIRALKGEDNINAADLEGFNALLESLMDLNLTGLAMECFYLMKSFSCDPDRRSFKILIDGLKLNGESSLLDVVHKDAKKCYGNFVDFLEEETEVST
ncbi:Vacuolar sorting protein 9 (VPS9) domain [Striga hermonthica]|uniref:Vacuolar sorting protein 9 (VPS9) domain n=1 Tax=Striga hermonthica TaxID=68872 RepID=A0A9N7RG81_STRHE|nr:Vacuolar sorting protein 9 (VPS9) domain [Striga hermonthica]